MIPTAAHDDDCPDLARWTSEGGAEPNPKAPITQAEVLEVLDFLAAHVPGHVVASTIAANLAAAIRVRGLRR